MLLYCNKYIPLHKLLSVPVNRYDQNCREQLNRKEHTTTSLCEKNIIK
jgi:hypothetical protein